MVAVGQSSATGLKQCFDQSDKLKYVAGTVDGNFNRGNLNLPLQSIFENERSELSAPGHVLKRIKRNVFLVADRVTAG